MSDGHRSGRSTGRVSCKSTELKRCSMIEMRWNKYEVSIIIIIIILRCRNMPQYAARLLKSYFDIAHVVKLVDVVRFGGRKLMTLSVRLGLQHVERDTERGAVRLDLSVDALSISDSSSWTS